MRRCTLLLLALSVAIPRLLAQTGDVLQVAKLAAPIDFDGLPFEEAWQAIEPLPTVVFIPTYMGEPTEKTEFRIAHDHQYFYVSGRLYDSDPASIQGNSLIRDFNTAGDFFNVCIDTFNDNETYWYFGTTPSGNRLDAEIPEDGESPGLSNFNWNTFWDVKVQINGEGWFVEMRIPFSSLRFKTNGGPIIIGFSVNRLIGRKFERHVFPNIPPNWPAAVWKASQAKKLILNNVEQNRPLYIAPYTLSGFNRDNEVNRTVEGNQSLDNWNREVGLDLKMGIASNYALDLTLNTDFAQAEADEFQANLSRFSLFFPEKRQFFQERAGVFAYGLSGLNRLFNSRVIGLTPDGDPLRVYGGFRFVGRSRGNDLGALSLQTDGTDSTGSENFSILRYRKRIFNKNSFVGAIALSRIDQNGNYNFTYGLDASVRAYAQNFLSLKIGQSITGQERGYFMYGKWEKRAYQGLGYSLELDKTSDEFDPGMGFILRRNLFLGQKISYGILPEKNKTFQAIVPQLSNALYFRNLEKDLETRNTKFVTDVTLRNGSFWNIGYQHIYDRVTESFNISEDVIISTGEYNYGGAILGYGSNNIGNFRFSAAMEVGKFYSGTNYSLSVSPRWNPSKHLELQWSYAFNQINFGQEVVRADIATFRALYAVDLKWSLSSLLQYNKMNEKIGINLRLRYNPSEGRDLYLVFTQLNNITSRQDDFEIHPSVAHWNLLAKYTHTLNLTK